MRTRLRARAPHYVFVHGSRGVALRGVPRRFARDVLPLIAAGTMRHVIDRTFDGLDQAQAAHDYMESNANAGKIVLSMK